MKRKQHVRFVTETGMTVEIEECIELTDHLTGEIYAAHAAHPEQAVLIPGKWLRLPRDVLALRDDRCYRRQRKQQMRGAA